MRGFLVLHRLEEVPDVVARYDSAVADEKVARFEQERDSRFATEAGDRARVARASLEVLRMARHVNEKPVGGDVTAFGRGDGDFRVRRAGKELVRAGEIEVGHAGIDGEDDVERLGAHHEFSWRFDALFLRVYGMA